MTTAPDSEPAPVSELRPEERYLNRELSWLDFDRRVLALAEDARQPLLERIKFLAITSRNLDEFFQVRVAGLHAQREAPRPRHLARRPHGRSSSSARSARG